MSEIHVKSLNLDGNPGRDLAENLAGNPCRNLDENPGLIQEQRKTGGDG